MSATSWFGRLAKTIRNAFGVWRDLASVGLPTLLVIALAFGAAIHFIQPAPPDTVVMSTGPDGSLFQRYAERYRQVFARNGITLRLIPSRGSVENLARLADPHQRVDIAFVQSGLRRMPADANLVSLGSVANEPLFILYRAPRAFHRLADFTGRRLAIGRPGSGTEALALTLLEANGIHRGGTTRLVPLAGDEAMRAVLAHRVDAVFLSGDSAKAGEIRRLLHTPGIRIFGFDQIGAYLHRFRYLNRVDVPMGLFDLGRNVPDQRTPLVAPAMELVARASLHPALVDLMIEAAQDVHSHATLLQAAGTFPSPVERDFPMSAEALRYYKSGQGLAYRYLPFWLASLVNRLIVLLLPVVILLLPAMRALPGVYAWRVRRRIYRHYGTLVALERESAGIRPGTAAAAALLERLNRVERDVIEMKLPNPFADEAYGLRQHLHFVRARLSGDLADGTLTQPVDPAHRPPRSP